MDFSGAVEWWDEWQLLVLVLGSLFIQYMLFFSSMARWCALPYLLRLFIWLAYLGGDALAIYALATLFNRHKQRQEQHDAGSGLEVLWTPVLLIHLGGQHLINAYSIQDNELWSRHALTMVSQVTVALYVFCKSWSGEKRLLQAAVLLFVGGIIRSIQKPWGMRNASVNNTVATFSLSTRRGEITGVASWLVQIWLVQLLCACSFGWYQSLDGTKEEEGDEEKDMTLEQFVHEASKNPQELASDQQQAKRLATTWLEQGNVFGLLVDISAPYSIRIKSLQLLMTLDYRHANSFSIDMLDRTFLFLYAKLPAIFGAPGCGVYFFLPFLTLVSAILFYTNHRNLGYNATDVKVTYILFPGTAVLDLLLFLTSTCIAAIAQSEKVSQHNILSYCVRKKQPTILMKLAALFCCKGYVNMHYYTEHVSATSSHFIFLVWETFWPPLNFPFSVRPPSEFRFGATII